MFIVVGGHSRNIGKTSAVCSIISTIPEADWTAVKITQHGHSVCATHGEPCGCAPSSTLHPFALDQEPIAGSDTDSGRFLKAGAKRSFWLRTAQGQLGEALGPLHEIIDTSPNLIVESN